MLIIPLTGKLSWRNPPFITLGVILINCLIYFAFQSGDMQRLLEAEQYYFNSGLAAIELPEYIQYLEGSRGAGHTTTRLEDLGEEELARYPLEIEKDYDFSKKLRNDRIIIPQNPAYVKWKKLRRNYEQKLSRVVMLSYGFRPAYASLLSMLSHMFLHGSFGHLLGNMIFLWIVGVALELGCGRVVYTGIYIFGGLLAVILYWIVYMTNTMPLVGASGAIAGLMGAFTALFGKKRVNIFYTLGFYFNYIKMPAIILLPVWLGKELFQQFFGEVSQVAYVAHIGGLIGGAILGLIVHKYSDVSSREVFTEEAVDEISPLMAKALDRIGELDLKEGRRLLEEILVKDPENITALTHLFNILKNGSGDQRLHEVAKKLLNILSRENWSWEKAYQIYADYIHHAGAPRLSPQLYLRMSTICATSGHPEKSRAILTSLIKNKVNLPGISSALLKLAEAYRSKGNSDNWKKCLQVVSKRYPDTPEAQMAKKMLSR
jgi:membrane associated rhomboid family serine protease